MILHNHPVGGYDPFKIKAEKYTYLVSQKIYVPSISMGSTTTTFMVNEEEK